MVKNVDGGQVGNFLGAKLCRKQSTFILNFVNSLKQ
jgi:hypothetical protein